jgi:AraC-like DNA-binding protein
MPETRQVPPPGWVFGRRLAAGERIKIHRHEQPQLVYPAEGLLAVTTSRGTWIAPPHRAVWIPAWADHCHQSYANTDMRALLFDPGTAAGQRAEPAVIAVSGLLRELILALTGAARRPKAARGRLEQVTLDQLLESSEQPLHLPEPSDDRLQAITALLHADPAARSTLAQLGQQVGASERTLSRLFHTELAMSFHQWRTQLRIHHALMLLADGHSVTYTAAACGWANPSSFIDAFTRAVGQTPGRYSEGLRAMGRSRSEPGDPRATGILANSLRCCIAP